VIHGLQNRTEKSFKWGALNCVINVVSKNHELLSQNGFAKRNQKSEKGEE